jgi:nickel-dependent lactate racemase
MVKELGNVLVIGSIEPHYFAGYTGGRKSFLPGIASYRTIEMNHKLALDSRARSLHLKGNPVNEDMIDTINLLNDVNIFSIQIVLTGSHKIYNVKAGDLTQSFDTALNSVKEIFCVPLKEKGNIVLTVAPYPMDIDLYQSQKALENGKHALEDNGIIILISKCRKGVGDDSFIKLLGKSNTDHPVFDQLNNEYKLGYHKAVRIAQIKTYAQIWAVTDLNDIVIKKARLKPYHNIQSAVNDALKIIKMKNKKPKIIIMPQGSITIPNIN